MQMVKSILNILFGLFLVICIGVHVYGLASPFSDEPVASHIVHLVSYCLCLFALLKAFKYSAVLYALAAIYPFCYHLHCAIMDFNLHGRLNPICILVVVLMPVIGWWILQREKL